MSERKEKQFSGEEQCGHCGNTAPMEILIQHSKVRSHSNDAPGMLSLEWDAGSVYELLKCPACHGIMLRSYVWHSEMPAADVEPVPVRLYPTGVRTPRGLPPEIKNAFTVAAKIKSIDANLYGVQLGRVLEMVAHNRKADGRSLQKQLQSLADRNEIPARLVEVASALRRLRNIGAHASPGEELSPAEVPILEDLCVALLEYVYTAPHLLEKVEESFARLKRQGNKEEST